MIRLLSSLLVLSALTLPIAPARAADTVVTLTESATVLVPPDELTATLRAEAIAASARDAQARVNAAIRDALAIVAQTPGVQPATQGYQVWRAPPTPSDRAEKWQAAQGLRLTGADGAALLTLVGALQQKGLAVSALQWRLSRDTERKARQEATRQAMRGLRARAEEAAELLDLRFDHFRAVRLDGSEPVPFPRAMSTARAMDAAPPVAVADDVPVTASAQAEAVLTPR